MKKLFIFTASYPFSSAKEDTFLVPELSVLQNKFDITLIPLSSGGDRHKIHESVKIITDYAEKYRSLGFLLLFRVPTVFFGRIFYVELLDNLNIIFNIKAFKRLILSCLRRKDIFSWLKKYHRTTNCFNDSILYTYWFDYATSAVIDICKEVNNSVVCTRAHGYDLYKERHSCNFIPFRKKAIDEIDRIFFVSENGYKYLSDSYPFASNKFKLSPLGINNRNIKSKKSTDNCFRIISCSFVSPVKRIDLIIKVIYELSQCTNIKIEWFHIGGGNKLESIKQYAEKMLSGKASFNFLGNISNNAIFEFYKNQALDLFIILSESEGKPVALMEAVSVSLPVVATDVGGIPELVISGVNGILVDVNETPINIALEIKRLTDSPDILEKMKSESYKIWQKNANADVNFSIFADQLSGISIHK